MRIGVLLQSMNETVGGIGVYTQEIVRALLEVDTANEYVLIYPGFGPAQAWLGQFRRYRNARELVTGASRVPFETYWDQVVIPKVGDELGLDVVFNPHLSVPIRGRFGKVMVVHNVEYHTVPNVYNARMYTWWYLMEKFIMPAADRVISLSKVMTEDFRRHVKYPISQVRTIYHGVNAKFFARPDDAHLARIRADYDLPEHYLLFVGHLYPQKNFPVLVRALGQVKDEIPHTLLVAGRPRYKFEADLALIAELGLQDRVVFLNYVPNDDLPSLYRMADAFVYPSLYESFGLAQLEAMACDCPVIGANAGAIPEVTAGAALIFDPHSPDDLAQAIRRVTGDPAVRADLVAKGAVRVRDFTWERTARETLAVFQELA
ncbi:MAG: glycosyltransferase family 1 protein [Vicinamibacterales bacterium]